MQFEGENYLLFRLNTKFDLLSACFSKANLEEKFLVNNAVFIDVSYIHLFRVSNSEKS
jgi:hypothetical protein